MATPTTADPLDTFMPRTSLGMSAVRRAVHFGVVTYETGGTPQLLAAKTSGWLRKDNRYSRPTYRATKPGRAALAEHERETA